MRLSEFSYDKSCLKEKNKRLWLVWLAALGSQWLDSTSYASAGGEEAEPTFGNLACWWWYRTHAAERGNGFLPSGPKVGLKPRIEPWWPNRSWEPFSHKCVLDLNTAPGRNLPAALVFVVRLTNRTTVAQGFLGGSRRRTVAQTRLAAPKMPRSRWHSPTKGRLRR